MKVTLKLRGPLSKFGPDTGTFEYDITTSSCTIKELLEMLSVPISSVLFVTVDGDKTSLDTELQGGENIVVYPRVAGG